MKNSKVNPKVQIKSLTNRLDKVEKRLSGLEDKVGQTDISVKENVS